MQALGTKSWVLRHDQPLISTPAFKTRPNKAKATLTTLKPLYMAKQKPNIQPLVVIAAQPQVVVVNYMRDYRSLRYFKHIFCLFCLRNYKLTHNIIFFPLQFFVVSRILKA